MIVIKDVPNQLGNRMFAFASVIAFAAENDLAVFSKSFEDYKRYFPEVNSGKFGGLKIATKFSSIAPVDLLATKFLRLVVRFQKKIAFPRSVYFNEVRQIDLDNVAKESRSKYVFLDSWEFPISTSLFQKHADKLRAIFSPDEERKKHVNDFISKQRTTGQILVGVHRRLGDYKQFYNGNYFYSDEVYLQKMQMLKQQAEEKGKSISFIISSNENFDHSKFSGVKVEKCSGDFVEDLYSLAECDYIFGPPSTFSQWASFYGKKPLYLLKTKNEEFSLAEFSPIIRQNEFANGKSFSHV